MSQSQSFLLHSAWNADVFHNFNVCNIVCIIYGVFLIDLLNAGNMWRSLKCSNSCMCSVDLGFAFCWWDWHASTTSSRKVSCSAWPETCSCCAWMDGELFHEWFQLHFLQYAPTVRPLLLLLDGHSSHYRLEFIHEASTQGNCFLSTPKHHSCVSLWM